jgi:hypothetical protein
MKVAQFAFANFSQRTRLGALELSLSALACWRKPRVMYLRSEGR